MSNPEQDMINYLRENLAVSRHQLANHRQLMRRALAIIASVGIAFLISASACMWSVYGVYRQNAEVIEQAMIQQSMDMAMIMGMSQDTNMLIDMLPDGKVAVKDTE